MIWSRQEIQWASLSLLLSINLAFAAGSLQDAQRQYKTGQFLEAIKTAISFNTSDAYALAAKTSNVLAATLPEAKQEAVYNQADEYARKAIGLNPKNAEAYAERCRALGRLSQLRGPLAALAQGLISQIRDNAEQALKLEPQNLVALIGLGIWHAEVTASGIGGLYGGSNDRALAFLRQAVQSSPQSPSARLEYARILLKIDRNKNLTLATEQLEQGLKLNAEDMADTLELERIKTELSNLKTGK